MNFESKTHEKEVYLLERVERPAMKVTNSGNAKIATALYPTWPLNMIFLVGTSGN